MLSLLSIQSFNNALKRSFLYSQISLRFTSDKLTATSGFIRSKELRELDNIKKPAPWPYEKKRYSYFHLYFELTTKRFDGNTKLLIVDGNIGSGKTTFAKQLADAFDMKYMPEPDLEDHYVTPYGYDIRKLDPILPWVFKSCDLAKFYEDPHGRNVAMFQFRMYMRRFSQYIDALAHILNTGQGVVMDRCVFGDRVFLETMHTSGYIRKDVRDFYVDVYNNCMEELMRPHLIIYLDISSETALKRIKERNDPIEVNSKVLTKEYLDCIEYEYKQNYLPKMESHAELLIYDWNNFGDVEVVVEDIEKIDFKKYGKYDDKLKDWRKYDEWEWSWARRRFTTTKGSILDFAKLPRPRLHELFPSGEEHEIYTNIMEKVPGEYYAEGWNPDVGDKVLFKLREKSCRHLPKFRYHR